MKSFFTSGTGNQQTLTESQTEKIPVYETESALDADLANLADGQIVAIKDEGASLSVPIDEVKSGDMHAVTSNAVAKLVTYSSTEKEAGYYYNTKKYHKTYVFENVNITIGTGVVLQSNFEIPLSNIVDARGFAVNASYWFNNLNVYVAEIDNQLCILPNIVNGTFTVVLDVTYTK